MAENDLANSSLTIQGAAVGNPARVYLAALAPTGRRSMAGALAKVAALAGEGLDLDSMPWAQLRYEHLQAIRARLAESGAAPATVNKTLAAVRGTMRAAWRLGMIDAETYSRIADVPGVRGSSLPAGRGVTPGELAAMMRACATDRSAAGARDAAIIAVAYAAGLRRAELAGLQLGDLVSDDGELITLRVLGKGTKERLAYLDNGGAAALRGWLQVRGTDPGALFYAGRRGGHVIAGQGMTAQAVHDVVARRAQQAGAAHTSPHDLRRSFVGDLLDAGADIATVAALAGHASVQTTQRYDRRGEASKKRAARSLHVPYSAPNGRNTRL